MPFDGLSFSNLGTQRIITPMEVASMAEQTAKVQAAEIIKKPEESQKSKSDIDDNEKDSKNYNSREEDNDTNENLDLSNDENKQKALKKYKVKFNQMTDMVELIDYKTGFVIETISPSDLMGIVAKTSGSSGILVDREV